MTADAWSQPYTPTEEAALRTRVGLYSVAATDVFLGAVLRLLATLDRDRAQYARLLEADRGACRRHQLANLAEQTRLNESLRAAEASLTALRAAALP